MDLQKHAIERILYPLMEIKSGNKTRRYLKELHRSAKLTSTELEGLQRQRLSKLLLSCVDRVEAYRDYSFLKERISADPEGALRRFPVLTKARFRQDGEAYLNADCQKEALIENRTGGSTGEPIRFYMDRFTVEHYEAARWRGLSWWNITPGSRSVMIWGNSLELEAAGQEAVRRKDRLLKNRVVLSAYDLRPAELPRHMRFLADYKPEYLYGYATALYTLAEMMRREGLSSPCRLKAVVSTSETLFDYQRESIGEVFGCPVVNEYGAKDAGILAYQCRLGGMHIASENAFLEVVDPVTHEPLPRGESGLLVVTDLNNFCMPRLRYALGDRATLSDKSCACGMALPLLEKIDGREDDMFVKVGGGYVHGHAFNHLTRRFHSVAQFRIVQLRPDYAELTVVKTPDAEENEIEAFRVSVAELLPGTEIKLDCADSIERTVSGKERYAVRLCPLA